MSAHKIQSDSGLTLQLDQVPKMLGKLTSEWSPHAFVVSFKLETDESILQRKAEGAIKKYHVNLVVANILQTRKDLCYLVYATSSLTPDKEEDTFEMIKLSRPSTSHNLESVIIDEIWSHHSTFVERKFGELTCDNHSHLSAAAAFYENEHRQIVLCRQTQAYLQDVDEHWEQLASCSRALRSVEKRRSWSTVATAVIVVGTLFMIGRVVCL